MVRRGLCRYNTKKALFNEPAAYANRHICSEHYCLKLPEILWVNKKAVIFLKTESNKHRSD